jgi:hypothetical protein
MTMTTYTRLYVAITALMASIQTPKVLSYQPDTGGSDGIYTAADRTPTKRSRLAAAISGWTGIRAFKRVTRTFDHTGHHVREAHTERGGVKVSGKQTAAA